MTLSPRDRRAIVLGAGGLVVILVVYYVLLPWLGGWADARSRLGGGRAELAALQAKMHKLLRLRARLVEAYGEAATRPPADAETAAIDFVETVPKVLKAGGIELRSIQPQTPRRLAELPGVRLLPFQVRGVCQLPQLTKCLAGLRQARTLVLVDQLSVTSNPKEPGKLELVMVLATLARWEKATP